MTTNGSAKLFRGPAAIYGMMSRAAGVPRLLSLWRAGRLRLEEAITWTYLLEDINEGYADLKAGRIIRGVVRYF